ncbi:MAG TPA: hypothetical protein PK406_14145 [Verrucomicrobiota bacterium]|nr:hypothetical protein [Verrucomicrobiota bacterium]
MGRWRSAALLAGLVSLPLDLWAQAVISATPVEHTVFGPVDDRALAAHWGLKPEEVQRYRDYMRVEGRYFYRHLDPVMVLGILEADPARRARYAEQYLEGERRRVEQQTGFASLVAATQLKRYGREALFDFSKLPQAAGSPNYLRARANRPGSAPAVALSLPPAAPGAAAPPAIPQAGDTVDLLVAPDCRAPCHDKLNELLKTPGVRILVYGRGFQDPPALVAWLEQRPATPDLPRADERIEPRRFDAVVFGPAAERATPPLALLRRHGVVIGTL